MKKLFLGVYNPSILLTYLSVFCSLSGMALLQQETPRLPVVLVLLIFAACCDMFDGKVAKLCKRTQQEKAFGIQLDSLADTVSFVVFPALIILKLAGASLISLPAGFLYLFAGIMRLGWFNITTESNPGLFQGMPVVYNALVYPLLYLVLSYTQAAHMGVWFVVAEVVMALLMIGNFQMKKPGLKVLLAFAALAVLVTVLLLCL